MVNPDELVCDFDKCGKVFMKLKAFKLHRRIHSQSKPYACDYADCKAAYFRSQHLKRHIENIHSDESKKDFRCEEEGCLASFETLFSLSQHRRKVHPSQKSLLKCSFCDSTFQKEWQVKEHETSHTRINTFRCSQCDEVFETQVMLKVHEMENGHQKKKRRRTNRTNEIKPLVHKCRKCSAAFESRAELRIHQKAEHKIDVFPCNQCHEVYNNATSLQQHQSTHSENDRIEFKCTFPGCSRVYSHNKNLSSHIRTFHEGKRHVCDICAKELSTKQKLTGHIAAIHGPNARPQKKKKPPSTTLRKRLEKQLSGPAPILELPKKKKPVVMKKHISQILIAKKNIPFERSEEQENEMQPHEEEQEINMKRQSQNFNSIEILENRNERTISSSQY